MLEDFLKLSIIINGKLLPLLFRVIKGDKNVVPPVVKTLFQKF